MEKIGQQEALISKPSAVAAVNTAQPALGLDIAVPNSTADLKPKSQALHQAPSTAARKSPGKFIQFIENFLHDEWGTRKFFALGNEIAESFHESLFSWLPEPVARLFYRVFWSLAFVATGARVATNYSEHTKPEEKLKAGAKLLLHDGISAIVAPTIVARVTGWMQDKIYDSVKIPTSIKNFIRPVGSLFACYKAIGWLDPRAQKLSAKLTDIHDDHHKKINDDRNGNGNGNGHVGANQLAI